MGKTHFAFWGSDSWGPGPKEAKTRVPEGLLATMREFEFVGNFYTKKFQQKTSNWKKKIKFAKIIIIMKIAMK